MSSLILTVKLALLGDPRLFPYEIEVEAGSDEVTLAGKVSSEAEKAAAADIASTVPTVKSVSNKLEVVKELPEAHRAQTRRHHYSPCQRAIYQKCHRDGCQFRCEDGTGSGVAQRRRTIPSHCVGSCRSGQAGSRSESVKTDKVRIESEG